jgi:dihydrofolate synthase/folylpolyglutamate synthase
MAFSAFEKAQVDIAIIEVGMGGRLDSTNVITPMVSVITNIDLDHMEFLGNTRAAIAIEKAGIFKKNIPVVIGQKDKETEKVFLTKAKEVGTEIIWTENHNFPIYEMDLLGDYQIENQRTALTVLQSQKKFKCSENSIKKGLKNISKLTGISGRWQIINDSPFIVIDSAHNSHGMSVIMKQWRKVLANKSRGFMILGAVKDKNLNSFWDNIPKECIVYYTRPSIQRGLPARELYLAAKKNHFSGTACDSFSEAFQKVKTQLKTNDALFIGGSTFLVADVLKERKTF